MKSICLFLLLIFSFSKISFSQNVVDEEITYKYKKLPLNPIKITDKKYVSSVILAYEEEDRKKKEEFEKTYSSNIEEYKKKKEEAEANYQKEKKEYKEKSFGEKLAESMLLKENQKPVKETVSNETVEIPFLHKAFDKELLSSTYIKLDGYEKAAESNLKIIFTIHGVEWIDYNFEEIKPWGMNASKETTKYSVSFKYRSPISIKVIQDDNVILSETVPITNEYKVFTSSKFDRRSDAEKNMPEKIIHNYEQKLTEENLVIANKFLNDRCATSISSRKTKLYNVESKKVDYSDYQGAFISAMEGYILLIDDSENASEKIKSSISKWEEAIKDFNISDKNARVNEEVYIATLFNLIEAYTINNDFIKAKLLFVKTKTLDLSKKEEKRFEELKILLEDLQKRFDAQSSKE